MKFLKLVMTISFLLFLSSNGYGEINKNPSELNGIWKGVIKAAMDVELYWRVQNGQNGQLNAFYDSPFYGIKDVPVTATLVEPDSVYFSVSLFPSTFYGNILPDSGTIHGFYSGEGDGFIELTLERISEDPNQLLPFMVPRLNDLGNQEYNYQYKIPKQREKGWPTGNMKDHGLSLDLMEGFTQQVLKGKYPNLHSLLIVKDGSLVYEEYFYGNSVDKPHPIYSNGKGLTSLCIGIANDEGLIKELDTPIYTYFPECPELENDPEKKNITVKILLSMTAGFQWDETTFSYYDHRNSNRQMMDHYQDPLGFLFSLPMAHSPGETFTYNSGLPQVLNQILLRETGIQPWTFMEENIFKPLGFENYVWDITADGRLGGKFLRSRDFAKLAKLYLDRGKWREKQIISPTWFENCYKDKTPCEGFEYWNHWSGETLFVDGIPVEEFSGGGFGGQSIKGFPDLDLIVVFTAGNYFTTSFNQEEIMKKYILPPLVNHPEYSYPDFSLSPGFTELDNLEYKDIFFTGLGSLWGCLDYLESDLNEAWIYGITGTAFAINGHPEMYPNCIGRWSNPQMKSQLAAAGYKYSTVAVYRGHPKFKEYQELGWNKIRESINNGFPAYAFHMNLPENYVVYGYDDYGYYFKGTECPIGYGPKCWNQVAENDVGWFEVHTVEPNNEASSKEELVQKSLEYAVQMYDEPEVFQHGGYHFGLKAYDDWGNVLLTGEGDYFGVAYSAKGWATCRRNAVLFLNDCLDYVDEENKTVLKETIHHFEIVAECWEKVSGLFPYEETERWQKIENWEDIENRERAYEAIESAKDNENEALQKMAILIDNSQSQ